MEKGFIGNRDPAVYQLSAFVQFVNMGGGEALRDQAEVIIGVPCIVATTGEHTKKKFSMNSPDIIPVRNGQGMISITSPIIIRKP